jgi:hypothetical protein
MKRISMLFGGLVAILCVSAMSADDKPTTQTDYFLGDSKMSTPSGQVLRTTLSLVKRVVNPAENRIEEHVMSIDEKSPASAFVVIFDVKGSKFTMTEKSSAFTGEGELIGDAWKWKEWKSVSKLSEGAGVVTSNDKFTDHGMAAKKTFAGPDGQVRFHFDESLVRITPKAYEILYAKLAPAKKK